MTPPASAGRGCPFDDGVDAVALPVLAVVVAQGDQIAAFGDRAVAVERLDADRVRGRRVGRPEQHRTHTGRSGHGGLGERELQPELPAGHRAHVDMAERVVTELVALADQPTGQVRVFEHSGADDEERGVDIVAAKHVEYRRGPSRIGAIIERQRHRPLPRLTELSPCGSRSNSASPTARPALSPVTTLGVSVRPIWCVA